MSVHHKLVLEALKCTFGKYNYSTVQMGKDMKLSIAINCDITVYNQT